MYKRAAKATQRPSRLAHSVMPRPTGFHRMAESSWSAGTPDDRINDRLPSIFDLGREPLAAWTAGGPHHKQPSPTQGRPCCAEVETWDVKSTWRLAIG